LNDQDLAIDRLKEVRPLSLDPLLYRQGSYPQSSRYTISCQHLKILPTRGAKSESATASTNQQQTGFVAFLAARPNNLFRANETYLVELFRCIV
jgi:hypothetical protein